jgi:hypothetical protein
MATIRRLRLTAAWRTTSISPMPSCSQATAESAVILAFLFAAFQIHLSERSERLQRLHTLTLFIVIFTVLPRLSSDYAGGAFFKFNFTFCGSVPLGALLL